MVFNLYSCGELLNRMLKVINSNTSGVKSYISEYSENIFSSGQNIRIYYYFIKYAKQGLNVKNNLQFYNILLTHIFKNH